MRTHLVLPEQLVEKIDAIVGKRKRSKFVEEAVAEKLRRMALLAALEETAGILSEEAQPEWSTSEKAGRWIRRERQEADKRLER